MCRSSRCEHTIEGTQTKRTTGHEETIVNPLSVTATVEGGYVRVEVPFEEGVTVDVIVVSRTSASNGVTSPLRGLPVRYDRPFDLVAADDWEAAR
jgi:hypothetical protein